MKEVYETLRNFMLILLFDVECITRIYILQQDKQIFKESNV